MKKKMISDRYPPSNLLLIFISIDNFLMILLNFFESSNLASIFNQETSSAQPIKKSLTYTAPKQPINTQPSQPVIAVAAVACYKL